MMCHVSPQIIKFYCLVINPHRTVSNSWFRLLVGTIVPLGIQRRWLLTQTIAHHKGGLTFPAAMSDRANWYQRWNSSKANFMALSKHWFGERSRCRHLRRASGTAVSACLRTLKQVLQNPCALDASNVTPHQSPPAEAPQGGRAAPEARAAPSWQEHNPGSQGEPLLLELTSQVVTYSHGPEGTPNHIFQAPLITSTS